MSRDDALLSGPQVLPSECSRLSDMSSNAPLIRSGIKRPYPNHNASIRTTYVIGMNGDVITQANLPSPHTQRWVIRRKAEVVLAVRAGMLSLEEACSRYQLTVEEYVSWETAIERQLTVVPRSADLQVRRRRKTINVEGDGI
jgi:hypothetical protein